jgi:heavy metal sensor kinase
MGETIRVRLTLWYASFLAGLLLVFAGIVTMAELRNEAIELDATLRTAAVAAGELLEPDELGDPPPQLSELIGAERIARLLYVRLLSVEGRPLKLVGDARLARQVPLPRHWPVSGVFRTLALPGGGSARIFREERLDANGRPFRVEVVGIIRDHHELERLLRSIALAAPPTLGLAVLMGLFLAGRALQPMEAITRTAQQLSAGDLSRRIGLSGPSDEIKRLADTFDAMLGRLEASFRSQQSFVADASHELRTPLTILQSHADLALSDPAADPSQCRRALEVVSAEVRRLTRVVASLLTLARADAGSLVVATEPVDLAELCEETLRRLRPLAGQRTITYQGPPELLIEGDADWLRQLLMDLVENAMHHTPVDGSIRITGKLAGDTVRVEVRDDGCGIAAEHLPHLFDRFYRVDKSRSRARGGAGLGLSIARWIVERHRGTIELRSQLGVGTTVVIALPAPAG